MNGTLLHNEIFSMACLKKWSADSISSDFLYSIQLLKLHMHINKASISMNFWSMRASSTFIHTPFKQQLFDLGGHLEFILSKKFIFLGVSLILAISPRPWPGTKSQELHTFPRLLYASVFWFYSLARDSLAKTRHKFGVKTVLKGPSHQNCKTLKNSNFLI